MAHEVVMPGLSPGMSEGVLVAWRKAVGDIVHAGEVLFEVETDKSIVEVESEFEGILSEIRAPSGGAPIPVNQVIAILAREGEVAPVPKASQTPQVSPAPQVPQASRPRQPPTPQPARPAATRVVASPLARRLASERELDLRKFAGSGPNGRIVRADIEAVRATQPTPSHALVQRPPREVEGPFEERAHTPLRRAIARRMVLASSTIPTFNLTVDCLAGNLLDFRRRVNADLDGPGITLNDLFVRIAAIALRRTPEINSSWTEESMIRWQSADVCLAVAVEGGLVTPIVKAADAKDLRTISAELRTLIDRAREGRLRPEEYQGGTFSITNLGKHGIRQFTAIINPPQAAILAIGSIEPRPVVVDGRIEVAELMTCTLTCDHRVVDGATAAHFLDDVRRMMEDPRRMLL